MAAAITPDQVQFGGYDFSFTKPVPDRFHCNICLKVFRDPHLTACCGQHFCESCLKHWLKKQKTICPHCREENFNHILNRALKREIGGLEIQCIKQGLGCQWVGELSSLQTHLDSDKGCGYVEVKCSNKCGAKMKRKELKAHLERQCPLRRIHCQYCHYEDTYQTITSKHYDECPHYPLPCPNRCGTLGIRRADMDNHRSRCGLEPVECQYHEAGCKVYLVRNEFDLHMSTNQHNHLLLLMGAYQETKRELVESRAKQEKRELHNTSQTITSKHYASTQVSLTSQQVNLSGAEVVAETNFVITKAENSYSWSGYGFKLHVPDDALPEHASEYQVNIKATLSGQFELPQGYKLVSAVYWVKAPGSFKKPVTVEIQHCGNTMDPTKLTFVVAKCTQKDLPYKFNPMKAGIFQPSSSYGVISLTKFSGPAVAAKEEVEDCYCGCVYQKQISSDHWRFYFLVMKRIEICMTTVQQKFIAQGREVHISKMNICFEDSSHSISLDIPGHGTTTDDWKVVPLFCPRITQEEANRLSDKDILTEAAITECVLVVKWVGGEGSKAAGPLFHTVKLKGAKFPEDYFNIVVDPSIEASSSNASPSLVVSPTTTATPSQHMPMNIVTRPTRSTLPTLPELLNFPGKDGKCINIPKRIGTRYFHFGILLLNDETGTETSAIISFYRQNIEQINLEILKMWISGKGKPLSWDVLIDILRESELNSLARDVQHGLHNTM